MATDSYITSICREAYKAGLAGEPDTWLERYEGGAFHVRRYAQENFDRGARYREISTDRMFCARREIKRILTAPPSRRSRIFALAAIAAEASRGKASVSVGVEP